MTLKIVTPMWESVPVNGGARRVTATHCKGGGRDSGVRASVVQHTGMGPNVNVLAMITSEYCRPFSCVICSGIL